MVRLLAGAALLSLTLLAGCAMLRQPMPAPTAAPQANAPTLQIETLPFRQGVSSVTVERLGKQQGCASREGAGLMTSPGPVEVYKMVCEGGKVFMARCELRQCRAM